MSKPIVLMDMDGVVADLIPAWLNIYNQGMGCSVTVEDIKKFEFSANADMGQVVYECLKTPGLFRNLKPCAGLQYVEELSRVSQLFVCSTPSSNPCSAAEKLEWCAEHLPFINRRHIILCARKDLVRGDFLIEDSPDNVVAWKEAFPAGKTILVDYPYNRECDPDLRVIGHKDMDAAWFLILQTIKRELL